MNRIASKQKYLLLIAVLTIAVFTLDGCASLRKKFTRKKKKNKEGSQEIAVLEPIEYPSKKYTPEDIYKHHFGLWQVWQKELISNLTAEDNRKRLLYQLNQIIVNLEEMETMLTDEKKALLEKSLKSLYRLKKDIESPLSSMSMSSWQIKLRSIERRIRAEYSVRKIKDYLKK